MDGLLALIKLRNPDFEYLLDRDPDSKEFLGMYCLMPYAKEILSDPKFNINVIGIDSSHMKEIVFRKCFPRILLKKTILSAIATRTSNNKHRTTK